MKKTIKDIPADILEEAVNKRLVEMLGFYDFKAIFTHNEVTGSLFINGEKIEGGKLANLKSEAEFILKTDLWKILDETLRFTAYERMFTKSKTIEDLLSGKMWLYHIDTQKKIMNLLKRVIVKPH